MTFAEIFIQAYTVGWYLLVGVGLPSLFISEIYNDFWREKKSSILSTSQEKEKTE